MTLSFKEHLQEMDAGDVALAKSVHARRAERKMGDDIDKYDTSSKLPTKGNTIMHGNTKYTVVRTSPDGIAVKNEKTGDTKIFPKAAKFQKSQSGVFSLVSKMSKTSKELKQAAAKKMAALRSKADADELENIQNKMDAKHNAQQDLFTSREKTNKPKEDKPIKTRFDREAAMKILSQKKKGEK